MAKRAKACPLCGEVPKIRGDLSDITEYEPGQWCLSHYCNPDGWWRRAARAVITIYGPSRGAVIDLWNQRAGKPKTNL